jgi:hypothetical protein
VGTALPDPVAAPLCGSDRSWAGEDADSPGKRSGASNLPDADKLRCSSQIRTADGAERISAAEIIKPIMVCAFNSN